MANPVWGLLEKAQDDPQTILEAIAELIAAHEADEEAHLGSGESLQSHRASEIIDHAAASIVADKFSAVQIEFKTYYESIGYWTKAGDYSNTLGSIDLQLFGGSADNSYINHGDLLGKQWNLKTSDCVYQESFYVDDLGGNVDICFGILVGSFSPSSIENYGPHFFYENGTLYARIVGTANSSYEITGVSVETYHVYRIHCDSQSETVKFYIDGTLVAELSWPTGDFENTIGIDHHIKEHDGGGSHNYNSALFYNPYIAIY